MKKTIGLFAGSFDPISNGHIDLIERGSRLFNEFIVLIAINYSKKHIFTEEERLALVKESVSHLDNVRVDVLHDGLAATYAKENEVTAMVRGIRNTTDFDYEFTIASANQTQNKDLETVILYSTDEYRYLSSSIIKEIAHYNGDISTMVPPNVEKAMKEKYNK
ncbi:pantetheine-phosphate adenylyltransferase [Aerococcaceae bacterium DSM 111022]|nr:pantetheine-phosphate adenylyltransferase [Aerococcaceae bacterium DSM 111022]